MIESIEKPQESIRKNRNPHRVIPAQAGIQKRNATGIYQTLYHSDTNTLSYKPVHTKPLSVEYIKPAKRVY
ncbi:hypothetical protein FOG14_10205 [Neisseria meningitidis]|nr:hypothetical protein [Neisseria meningitidis]